MPGTGRVGGSSKDWGLVHKTLRYNGHHPTTTTKCSQPLLTRMKHQTNDIISVPPNDRSIWICQLEVRCLTTVNHLTMQNRSLYTCICILDHLRSTHGKECHMSHMSCNITMIVHDSQVINTSSAMSTISSTIIHYCYPFHHLSRHSAS